MRSRDRRVHADLPINLASRVSVRDQLRQDTIPGAVTGIATVTFPDRLPWAELVTGQIPPRDPSAEAEHDALHDPPILTERMPPTAHVRWQQWLQLSPLRITQNTRTRPRLRRHEPSIPPKHHYIWETRLEPIDRSSDGQRHRLHPTRMRAMPRHQADADLPGCGVHRDRRRLGVRCRPRSDARAEPHPGAGRRRRGHDPGPTSSSLVRFRPDLIDGISTSASERTV